MEAHDFDRLAKSLPTTGSRRGVLGLLATLPVLGGLFALLGDAEGVDAKGRRKRRKKAHKHGKGRRRKHHKKKHKTCKPNSVATTCQGRCGPVKNNCKKTVDCGTCECASDAECQTGQICLDGMCEACTVCASDCAYATVQEAIDDPASGETILICPGAYGAITVGRPLRLVGAGDGPDDASNTILDAQEQGRVVEVAFGVTLTVERLRITGGAFNGGGAGVNNLGTLTMTGCTVTGNTTTDGPGAGIFNAGLSALNMTDCAVIGNETTGTEGLRNGAGIINNGTVALARCTIRENIAAGQGGGIHNTGMLTLDECDVENNRAEGGNGGGIRTGGVTGNVASGDGGGIFNFSQFGTVTLTDCNVAENDPNDCAGEPVVGTCGA